MINICTLALLTQNNVVMHIKSRNLSIESISKRDIDQLSKLCSSFDAMQFVPPTFSIENKKETQKRIEDIIRQQHFYGVSIGKVTNENGNFVGIAGFKYIEEVNLFELTYNLLPQYMGIGYATEICNMLIDYGFYTLNFDKMCARTIIGNYVQDKHLINAGFSFLGERFLIEADKQYIWNYYELENDHALLLTDADCGSIHEWTI